MRGFRLVLLLLLGLCVPTVVGRWRCDGPADCNDYNPCTADICRPDGLCDHTPFPCPGTSNACRAVQCVPDANYMPTCVERDVPPPWSATPCANMSCDPTKGWSRVLRCPQPGTSCYPLAAKNTVLCIPDACRSTVECAAAAGTAADFFCCQGYCTVGRGQHIEDCCADGDCGANGQICCHGRCTAGECCGPTDLAHCRDARRPCRNHHIVPCRANAECAALFWAERLTICDADTQTCRAPECASDTDCDTGDACSKHRCLVREGRCVHTPHLWPCLCHDSSDCAFASETECAFCDRGVCRHILACDDGDPYTEDAYDAEYGACVHTPLTRRAREATDARAQPCTALGGTVRLNALAEELYPAWAAGWRARAASLLGRRRIWDGFDPASTPLDCSHLRARTSSRYGRKTPEERTAEAMAARFPRIQYEQEPREDVPPFIVGICSDGDPCTTDVCGYISPNGSDTTCTHEPKNCGDDNVCTTDSCEALTGECVHEEVECAVLSGVNCTERECFPGDGLCYPMVCHPLLLPEECEPLLATENDTCKTYYCNEYANPPAWVGVDAACNDGDMCNLDQCITEVGCVHTPITCPDIPLSCRVVVCNQTTGELVQIVDPCSDGNYCTVDMCVVGVGCLHRYPDFVDTRECVADRSCTAMYVECVEYVCLDATTGEHMWLALPYNTTCAADDPCARYACDGYGHCALRPGASPHCFEDLFTDPTTTMVFMLLLLVMILAGGLVIFVVVFYLREQQQRLAAVGRRKKHDPTAPARVKTKELARAPRQQVSGVGSENNGI